MYDINPDLQNVLCQSKKQQPKSRTVENSESLSTVFIFFLMTCNFEIKNQNDQTKNYLLCVFLIFGKLALIINTDFILLL